jgi:hypothetical protein
MYLVYVNGYQIPVYIGGKVAGEGDATRKLTATNEDHVRIGWRAIVIPDTALLSLLDASVEVSQFAVHSRAK